jgi:hypothetical protein
MRTASVLFLASLLFICSFAADPAPDAPTQPTAEPATKPVAQPAAEPAKEKQITDLIPGLKIENLKNLDANANKDPKCVFRVSETSLPIDFDLEGVQKANDDKDYEIDAPLLGKGAKLYFRFCSGPVKIEACANTNADIAIVKDGRCEAFHLVDGLVYSTTLADREDPEVGFNLFFDKKNDKLTIDPTGNIIFSFRCGSDSSKLTDINGVDKDGNILITATTKNGE